PAAGGGHGRSPARQIPDHITVRHRHRWAAKGDDLFWNGYKVHLTETCDHESDTTGDHGGQSGPRSAPNL
ncbi:hypothetical protein ACLQ24_30805, partial [Micromonospora sp. DT4]